MNDDENNGPKADLRVVGQTPEGKIRIRGGVGFEVYRNLGLQTNGNVDFTPPLTSANQVVSRYRNKALKSARDTENNSETVRGALDRKSNTVVGPTLRPNPQPDLVWLGQSAEWMMEYQQAASSAFQEWATDTFCRSDGEGHYHFGGLMWQGVRTLFGPDAETLGYIGYDRERAEKIGAKWATFVHMLDPDRLSTPAGKAEGAQRVPGEPMVFQGREVDELMAMRALHIATYHPSEASSEPLRWERIPRWTDHGRPMAFHWFFKRRAGLQRAITTLAAVLSTIQMLSHLSTAKLQTAVSHSYMAAYLKTTMTPEQAQAHMAPRYSDDDDDDNKLSEWDLKAQAYDKMDIKFGGKRLPILGPNDEIKFENLEGDTADFEDFRNTFLRELASSLNISFEQLSLNFSLSNYSSTRSSLIEAWRQVHFERTMFCNHVASLIYDAVIEEAFALKILVEPRGAPAFYEARQAYTRCSWTGPGQGWVDPEKEINAAKGRMGSVVTTPQMEASAQGGNVFDNIVDRAVAEAFAKKHNVEIDMGMQMGMPGAAGDSQAAAKQQGNAND